jgi:hypothetical protein
VAAGSQTPPVEPRQNFGAGAPDDASGFPALHGRVEWLCHEPSRHIVQAQLHPARWTVRNGQRDAYCRRSGIRHGPQKSRGCRAHHGNDRPVQRAGPTNVHLLEPIPVPARLSNGVQVAVGMPARRRARTRYELPCYPFSRVLRPRGSVDQETSVVYLAVCDPPQNNAAAVLALVKDTSSTGTSIPSKT